MIHNFKCRKCKNSKSHGTTYNNKWMCNECANKLRRKDIQRCVKQKDWQRFRKRLKGLDKEGKRNGLRAWLRKKNNSKCAKVQVENYINALKRAGIYI